MHFPLPYVRIELLIRTMLTRTWAPEAWPLVKTRTRKGDEATTATRACWMVQPIIVHDYRGYRVETVAQLVDGAWNAGVRIRRTLSDMKPHVEEVTCRKPMAEEAEQAGELIARQLGRSPRWRC